jgi:hypothetical protein
MQKPSEMSQVKNGLLLAGRILLFLGVAGLFLAGVQFSVFPSEYSRTRGYIFLSVSIPIMIVTVNRWIKVLPGILGLAVFNGLIMISLGHLPNNKAATISRIDMLILTVYCIVSALVSSTFAKRNLRVVDRVAAFVVVCALALLLGHGSTRMGPTGSVGSLRALDFVALGTGLGFLLFAWAYDRLLRAPAR